MEASHFAAPARPYSQRALACVGQLADQVRQRHIPRKYFYPLQLPTLIIPRISVHTEMHRGHRHRHAIQRSRHTHRQSAVILRSIVYAVGTSNGGVVPPHSYPLSRESARRPGDYEFAFLLKTFQL